MHWNEDFIQHLRACVKIKMLEILASVRVSWRIRANACVSNLMRETWQLCIGNRGGDKAMHGSSNKCHIMLEPYTLDKVTLRLCKIYFSLRSNPACLVSIQNGGVLQ